MEGTSRDVMCFVCGKQVEKGVDEQRVGSKGLTGLIDCSSQWKDGKAEFLKGLESLIMHKSCNRNYTRKTSIAAAVKKENAPSTSTGPNTRSSQTKFDFKNKCFYCATVIDQAFLEAEAKKQLRKRRQTYHVRTLKMKEKVINAADQRGDQWGKEVKLRMAVKEDLVAVEAMYHQDCYLTFFTQSPASDQRVSQKRGRPSSDYIEEAMNEIYNFLEKNNDCQFSLNEVMDQITGEKPHERTVRYRLEQTYGDGISITTVQNRVPTVLFRGKKDRILCEAWNSTKKGTTKEERMKIVLTAAAIIKEDIKSVEGDTQTYPSSDKFLDNMNKDIPETLLSFIDNLLSKPKKTSEEHQKAEIKKTSIAHAIMKAVRPRTILSPLQDALALFLYRKYGSKILINLVHNLGFSSSYSDAQKLELSAIFHPPSSILPGAFVQFIFDNADFNVATIDGHNTFHSMGGIKCVTPQSHFQPSGEIVKLKVRPTAADIGAKGLVPVSTYEHKQSGLNNIVISDFTNQLPSSNVLTKVQPSDILWLGAKWLGLSQIPGWKGFMIATSASLASEKSAVVPISFVKAPPSNYDTIFTVINVAIEQCKMLNQDICIATFDQPLYIKARDIVASAPPNSDLSKVVVRLGGFHLLMSYLGSIGEIMAGSGLKELLCTVYAPHSVDKMLQGHAYARAVRAHILVQTSLACLIFDSIVLHDQELKQDYIMHFLSNFLTDTPTLSQIHEDTEIQQLAIKFSNELNLILENGPTATLWVQYFRMVSLMKEYITAERSGNWENHLRCVAQMVPLFHASGHTLYAKSSHLYLQDMLELPQKLSQEEFDMFVTQGYFTTRRTDSYWTGVWSDMLIEQTLMRNFKSVGGMTRGRGITDSTLTKYVEGIAATHNICHSLETFINLHFTSVEQHVDFRDSRIIRDASDVQTLSNWLKDHPPFAVNSEIMSLATGVIGKESVNCYKAVEVGERCLQKMIGQTFGEVKLARKDKVSSLAAMTCSVRTKTFDAVVDPLLIFQRISIVKESDDDLADCFKYELAPYPMSLFDESGMRKTKKASLYDVFTTADINIDLLQSDVVLDGGFLLHRVRWNMGANYASICQSYINYINNQFGNKCTVVFDGYEDTSKRTKNAEQQRRARVNHAVDVRVEDLLPVTQKQDVFLTNSKNKGRLITLLIPKLRQNGIQVFQSSGDADVLIVQTAIDKAPTSSCVIVVGEDVDLMVLLVALTPDDEEILFHKPGKLSVEPKTYSSNQPEPFFLKNSILFLHAFSGCDSTSAIFHQGKMKIVKLFKKDENLHYIPSIFYNPNSTPKDITEAGIKMFLALYGAKPTQTSLNEFRYTWFLQSARKTKPDLPFFPPTDSAAAQHCFRVYHQIQAWRGTNLIPESWGWTIVSSSLEPVHSLEPAAPEKVLNMIFCSCKTGCGPRCGCRKSGVTCTGACSQCAGVCLNKPPPFPEEDSSDDDMCDVTDLK